MSRRTHAQLNLALGAVLLVMIGVLSVIGSMTVAIALMPVAVLNFTMAANLRKKSDG